MLSLRARLLGAASLVLVCFLGLTGLALDGAFRESAQTSLRERLQAQIYLLLGAAELAGGRRLALPQTLAEPRFATPGSGLYAQVLDARGEPVWRSDSCLGIDWAVPAPPEVAGEMVFQAPAAGSDLFTLSLSVTWEAEHGDVPFTLHVAEQRAAFDAEVTSFRRALWGWLAAAAGVLLAVQGLILRWSLAPLRRVARELGEVESGRRARLQGRYPSELSGLTDNLNALLGHAEAQLERYRNALADLAHSLKTPLAVMRGSLEAPENDRDLMREQLARMDATVAHQLQRAAAVGRRALSAPIPAEPVARRVVDALGKVYADRRLELRLSAEPGVEFHGDGGDLTEVLGNLCDNACKWARSEVRLALAAAGEQRRRLLIEVCDDGPGIEPARVGELLRRGSRADSTTEGQGIGLAVVRDIVEEGYGGRLAIDASPRGGARVRATL